MVDGRPGPHGIDERYEQIMGNQTRRTGGAQAALSNRLPFVQKVYSLLAVSIGIAIVAGYMVMQTPAVGYLETASGQQVAVPMGVAAMSKYSLIVWVVLFGMLFLGRAVGKNPVAGSIFLFAFTAGMGAWIAPNVWYVSVLRDQPQAVNMAGFMTAIVFGGLTLYAWLSKHDFNFLGAGLSVAGIALIAAVLLNAFFFQSGWAVMFLSWAILVFAGGCVLFNTSRILRDWPEDYYVLAAITLFVDIVNMFLALLRIFSGGRD